MGLFCIFLLIIAVFLFCGGVRRVPDSTAVIIERLGKYKSTLSSGINFALPFLDKPKHIEWQSEGVPQMVSAITLDEITYNTPPQDFIIKEARLGKDINIKTSALIYFQIIDPVKAAYEVHSIHKAIENLTNTTLKYICADFDFVTLLTSREAINIKLKTILDEAANKWGIKINSVELWEVIIPQDIQKALEKQMLAERERRVASLKAKRENI